MYDDSTPFQFGFSGRNPYSTIGSFKYASKFTDQVTKSKEIYLINAKGGGVNAPPLSMQAVLILQGLRVERRSKDSGREYICRACKDCYLKTSIQHEFASASVFSRTLACRSACGESLLCSPRHTWRTGCEMQRWGT